MGDPVLGLGLSRTSGQSRKDDKACHLPIYCCRFQSYCSESVLLIDTVKVLPLKQCETTNTGSINRCELISRTKNMSVIKPESIFSDFN
jgi:hypothetical protein